MCSCRGCKNYINSISFQNNRNFNNRNELVKSMNRISRKLQSHPKRLGNRIKSHTGKTLRNVARSTERNLNDLSRKLDRQLESAINDAGVKVKKHMRKGNQRISNTLNSNRKKGRSSSRKNRSKSMKNRKRRN